VQADFKIINCGIKEEFLELKERTCLDKYALISTDLYIGKYLYWKTKLPAKSARWRYKRWYLSSEKLIYLSIKIKTSRLESFIIKKLNKNILYIYIYYYYYK